LTEPEGQRSTSSGRSQRGAARDIDASFRHAVARWESATGALDRSSTVLQQARDMAGTQSNTGSRAGGLAQGEALEESPEIDIRPSTCQRLRVLLV